eukprot:gene23008-biopygen20794
MQHSPAPRGVHPGGRNGMHRARPASVSLSSLMRPASGPRPAHVHCRFSQGETKVDADRARTGRSQGRTHTGFTGSGGPGPGTGHPP